jgi:hypothetical protein
VLEKNIQSGNKLGVLLTKSYWQTHTYQSLYPLIFFIDTAIPLKTNLYPKSYYQLFRIITSA